MVFGTRPELIKCAPVAHALGTCAERIETVLCSTGQHRDMLAPLVKFFGLSIAHDLGIMREAQSLAHIVKSAMTGMNELITREKPDMVLVQGDTSSAMACALAASDRKVPVGHIEAGLRTYDIDQPFPEELNRVMIDRVASLFFAPTVQTRDNLIAERFPASCIEMTGNTVIDALMYASSRAVDLCGTCLDKVPFSSKKVILVTAHRRENIGLPLQGICQALKDLAHCFENEIFIVIPVHPNPAVRIPITEALSGIKNVALVPPLDYPEFVHAMKNSYLIMSDSGGVQEEAPSLGKPVLVLRDVTERPEALQAGATRLAGVSSEKIFELARELITDEKAYRSMTGIPNPYGDGKAGKMIAERIMREAERHG